MAKNKQFYRVRHTNSSVHTCCIELEEESDINPSLSEIKHKRALDAYEESAERRKIREVDFYGK